LWLLGFPDAALTDADCARNEAREIGHAATFHVNVRAEPHSNCGNHKAAKAELEELVALANEKGAQLLKALATIYKGLRVSLSFGGTTTSAVHPTDANIREQLKCGPNVLAAQ
jgi:hypothetical protein